jgi:hypothetical protein
MSSPLFIPLALFAAATLVLTVRKAARVRDIEEEIRRRLHNEETNHRCKMAELEAELERAKQGKSSSLRALDPQKEQ